VSKERYIGLGLKAGGGEHGLADALRPVIDRALTLLVEALQNGEDGVDRTAALAQIDICRPLMTRTSDVEQIEQAGQELFTVCEATLKTMAAARAARQNELNSLIGLVREAVAAIAGDNHHFDASLDQSTARFEAMSRVDDLAVLKQQLSAEVTVLKRIAAERQKSWESTVRVFESQVATLEQQLVTTRLEASLDPLTRIANRRMFDDTCNQWVKSDRQFVLGLLDLDDFKQINDTHGHATGDKVLVEVASTLKHALRASDLVARYGGDEFAVLMAGVTLRQAEGRLKGVMAQLSQAAIIPSAAGHTGTATLPGAAGASSGITVSCGAAEFSAGDTEDSLLQRADQALYDAKKRGKGRVAVKSQTFIRDLLGR
jgi:diguanylate cyclase